jgi:fused signal recognition particle receptor
MAFGFVKKIFSFGKKAVEEKPVEDSALPSPEIAEAVSAPEAPVEAPETALATDVSVLERPEVPATAEEPGGEPEIPEPPQEAPQPEQPSEQPAPQAPPETPEPTEPVAPEPPEEVPPEPEAPQPETEPDIPPSAPEEVPPVEEPVPAPPMEVPPEPFEVPPSAPYEIPTSTPQEFAPRAGAKVTIGDAPVPAAPEAEAPKSWINRLTTGLSRSSRQLSDNITGVFTKRKLDDDTLQDLEDVLIQADLGIETAMRITDALASGRYGKDVSSDEVRGIMASEVAKVLEPVARPLELDLSFKPHVVLVVGVNGTGKTTTIGKLAAKLRDAGLKVTLGAGDTFRAAAIEQLKIWAERTGSTFVATKLGADAAGLAYDAFETAKTNGSDVVIIDTAGRLQNKAELMEELAKIVRVLQKLDPDAPHTVLQTLDATTGQNALNQVEIFRNIAGVNGLVMTKLDGTARGGILVAISAKYKLPVYFIGVGETVDDLEPFRASDFASAIAGIAA